MNFDNTSVERFRRTEFGLFGEPLYERGVSNYIPFRLYGIYKDIETGLYYNVRRYYDWRVGRYLQPDPVSDLNLYAYVNNSPYDLVDPVGMFETLMKPMGVGHAGKARHEEITQNAVNQLWYPKLREYGSAENYWDNGPWWYDIAQCRGFKNKLAQGVNRADCLYEDDSSYHCDNSNFVGCSSVADKVSYPTSKGVVECICVANCGGGGSIGGRGGGGGGSYQPGSGGGGGCSIINQRIRQKASSPSWQCYFKAGENYETLGRYLHPAQDFWSHSNSIFVPGCGKKICVRSPNWKTCIFGLIDDSIRIACERGCSKYECAEYTVETKYTGSSIPSPQDVSRFGLFSGLYGGQGWSAVDDILCSSSASWADPRFSKGIPCDVGAKIMAHCMLNKDGEWGQDRSCMNACDMGLWKGDCGGSDNIQRYAFWSAFYTAEASTQNYLRLFCVGNVGASLCY
jgi:RHS repeat-associated protein